MKSSALLFRPAGAVVLIATVHAHIKQSLHVKVSKYITAWKNGISHKNQVPRFFARDIPIFLKIRLTSYRVKSIFDVLKVCMDLTIVTRYNAKSIGWRFGACSSSEFSSSNSYNDFSVYLERCCVLQGQSTLTCHNTKMAQGWNSGYIEIKGHRYCDDFLSHMAMRRIEITGNQVQFYLESGLFLHNAFYVT